MKLKGKDNRTIQDYKLENFTFYHSNIENNNGRGKGVYIHHSIEHLLAVLKNDSFKEYCQLEIKPKGRDK